MYNKKYDMISMDVLFALFSAKVDNILCTSDSFQPHPLPLLEIFPHVVHLGVSAKLQI